MEFNSQQIVLNSLNEVGFNEVSENDKFNPEKLDFYDIKNIKKYVTSTYLNLTLKIVNIPP